MQLRLTYVGLPHPWALVCSTGLNSVTALPRRGASASSHATDHKYIFNDKLHDTENRYSVDIVETRSFATMEFPALLQ